MFSRGPNVVIADCSIAGLAPLDCFEQAEAVGMRCKSLIEQGSAGRVLESLRAAGGVGLPENRIVRPAFGRTTPMPHRRRKTSD